MATSKQILAVGNATVDIILTLNSYPKEDAEVRAQTLSQRRGGNACNTLVVLHQLGHACSWAGILAKSEASRCILEDLEHNAIEWRGCTRSVSGSPPTSYIWVNQHNGSRTIVHHRDLPEFSFEDFGQIDLSPFCWIHFEGRNIPALKQMLRQLKTDSPPIPISLEIEKSRAGIDQLFPLVDVLLFSKAYALQQGNPSGAELLAKITTLAPQAKLFCAWGDQGGYARETNHDAWYQPAYRPPKVIDTLAAGDVFNAGIIHALLQGKTTDQALAAACRLAGKKCGMLGLAGLTPKV